MSIERLNKSDQIPIQQLIPQSGRTYTVDELLFRLQGLVVTHRIDGRAIEEPIAILAFINSDFSNKAVRYDYDRENTTIQLMFCPSVNIGRA